MKQYTIEIRKPKKGEQFFKWNKSENRINLYTATYDFEIEQYPVISKPDTSEIDAKIRADQNEYWSRGSAHIPFDGENGRFG